MGYGRPTEYVVISKKEFSIRNGKAFFKMNNKINVIEYINSVKNNQYVSFQLSHHHIWCELGSGVYIFSIENTKTKKVDCAYVGCSVRLSGRLNQHPVGKMLAYGLCPEFKCTLHIIPCDNYKSLEKKLISDLNPFLNSDYNTKKNDTKINYMLPARKGKRVVGERLGHFITKELEVGIYG